MVFDSKDDDWLFIKAPDMDGDGKHSVIDLMIMDDLQNEEDKRRKRMFSSDEDDDEEDLEED